MGAGMLLAPCCMASIVALLAPGLLLLISARTQHILVLNASLPLVAAAVFILYFSGSLPLTVHGLVILTLLLLVLDIILAAVGLISLRRQNRSELKT